MINLVFKRPLKLEQRGSLLIGVVIMTFSLMVIAFSLLSFTSGQMNQTTRSTFTANAVMTAEAAIEQSLYSLNQDSNFAGYATEQTFFNNTTQGRGTYTTTVTASGDGNSKIITATGKVYRYGQSSAVSTRKVRVTAVGTASAGYSVHTGPGGLLLSGSANITNSDVYVNGLLTLTGSAKIGTAAKPLNVNVAHHACPAGNTPGPTYPAACASGQPIALDHSTAIYGTVCATNQTSTGPNNNIKTGTGGQGLVAGCVAPPVSAPSYDRAGHIADVVTTAAASNSAYTCGGSTTRTWPANLKLTGNVSLGGSCVLRITGNVYITGNLDIGGSTRIIVEESVGGTRPAIMVDGTIDIAGSTQSIANSAGTGIHFVSFKSAAACSPNCSAVTGTDLKNSENLTTVNVGSANLPGMILHAQWGKLVLRGSGSIGSAIGQKIDMSGSGTVTFGTSLSSGTSTWTITSYQRVY